MKVPLLVMLIAWLNVHALVALYQVISLLRGSSQGQATTVCGDVGRSSSVTE